mgnify:FL=1
MIGPRRPDGMGMDSLQSHGPVYYQDTATGETKTFLRWAQSYTLYHQNDGTLVGYARFSNGIPPISLRAIDTPPGAASGPNWPPASTFNAESTQFDQLRKELRTQGVNLQATKRIPPTWVELISEDLPMGFKLVGLVSPDYYSGYDADPYQQVISGQGEAGINQEGLGIILSGNNSTAKTIAFQGASLTRQLELFDDLVSASQKFLNPVVSYRNTGTVAGYSPLNTEGRRWQPGDLVNIARPTSDAGGLATAHVVRVYPTQVLVTWPNDADHPKSEYPRGWFTKEEKTDLIFIKNDKTWLEQYKKLPSDFSSRYGSESGQHAQPSYNMDGGWFSTSNAVPLYGDMGERFNESRMMGQAPPWATDLPLPTGLRLRTTPKKGKTDLYGEMDEIMLHIKRQEAIAQLTGLSL